MADIPAVTDGEIIEGWRAMHPHDAGRVRIVKRRRLKPTAGLTGSYFERVTVEAGGQKHRAVLKFGSLPYGPPTREGLFFREFAREVPLRVPEPYAVGDPRANGDAWVLMQAMPRGKRVIEWQPGDTLESLRNLAALHARYLDAAPAALPRPFSSELEQTLAFVPEGIRMLRQRYDELPELPRVVSDRQLDLLAALAARPGVLRAAFERSPETLLHGDYHRGNIVARDGAPQIVFDWQFSCAGPPAYDLAVFWIYLGAINKPGLFRLIDRVEVRERELPWQEITAAYGAALQELRADADLEAILSCADAVVSWEALRQIIYMGHGMETMMGQMCFIYRDHRTVGGWFARWLGIDQTWKLWADLFAEVETRAPRLLGASAAARGDGALAPDTMPSLSDRS